MGPIDVCPYRRPFPAQFTDCPAHEARPYQVTTMRGLPLASIVTCQHLDIGEYAGQRGRFYPRCALGDLAGRRQAFLRKLESQPAA